MHVPKKISSFRCIKRVKRGLAKHRSRTALTATEWNKTVPLDLPSALPQNTWRNQPSSFPPSVRSWPCSKNNIDLQRCDFPVILRKSKIKTAWPGNAKKMEKSQHRKRLWNNSQKTSGRSPIKWSTDASAPRRAAYLNMSTRLRLAGARFKFQTCPSVSVSSTPKCSNGTKTGKREIRHQRQNFSSDDQAMQENIRAEPGNRRVDKVAKQPSDRKAHFYWAFDLKCLWARQIYEFKSLRKF